MKKALIFGVLVISLIALSSCGLHRKHPQFAPVHSH